MKHGKAWLIRKKPPATDTSQLKLFRVTFELHDDQMHDLAKFLIRRPGIAVVIEEIDPVTREVIDG